VAQISELLALQTVAAGDVLASSSIDMSLNLGATVFVNIAPIDNSGAAGPVYFRLETNQGCWTPVKSYEFVSVSPDVALLQDNNNAGSTVLNITGLSALAPKQLIFLRNMNAENAASLLGSEWARVKSANSSTITLESPTLYDHSVGGIITVRAYNRAQNWACKLSTFSVPNLRLVVDASSAVRNIVVQAYLSR
jgi:hypothetical protein